jgi:predicted regulator of Ras-like GTPase activity (Roadblock/LC7/MglB family)
MKLHMFNPLRNLFRKLAGFSELDQYEPAPPAASVPQRRIVMAPRPQHATSEPTGHRQNGRCVELSLQPILANLPLELQPRLVQPDAGGLTISVPLEKILAQLSRGAVQISFGELRQAAPDFFSPENDRDRVLVPLPLAEILARLNPALITRRRAQKLVEVPLEISSPFDQRNRGLVFSVSPPTPPAAPASAPVQPQRQVTVPTPAPAPAPARMGITFAPTPPPPTATPPSVGTPPSVAMPSTQPAMNSTTRTLKRAVPPPALTPPPVAMPGTQPAMHSTTRALRQATPPPPSVAAPTAVPVSAPVPASASASAAPVAQSPTPAAEPNPLLISLTSLAEAWPEAVRKELVVLNLVDARVALPAQVAERALKQGRVAFTWKALRSWITPTPLPTVSAYDTTVVELPLKVLAPLFLARQKEAAKVQQKVSIDEDIPNLFFGFPQPESGGPAPAPPPSSSPPKPEDTNFYVWDDATDRVRVQEDEVRRGPSLGTRFVAKYATPNEIVSRAAALDGVVGALIALPDGLMVASRLSADLNGDTLAAFLPQIFGKITQCTKELRMGELNNVGFTVGNTPWKIFRVNAIFFAAFGRAGEPLPTAQLAALASELDHKPK